MRIPGAVLICCVALAGCIGTSPARVDPVEEEAVIRSLQEEWAAAYVALDTGRVGALLAEDYTVIHPETPSRIADRARAIRAILTHDPDRPIYAYEQEQFDIRFYGPVALVSAVSHLKMRHRVTGNESGIRSRYLHVWVKRDGRWKLVSRQATPMPTGN